MSGKKIIDGLTEAVAYARGETTGVRVTEYRSPPTVPPRLRHPIETPPDCMMPDGAEPCAGYQALLRKLDEPRGDEPAVSPAPRDHPPRDRTAAALDFAVRELQWMARNAADEDRAHAQAALDGIEELRR